MCLSGENSEVSVTCSLRSGLALMAMVMSATYEYGGFLLGSRSPFSFELSSCRPTRKEVSQAKDGPLSAHITLKLMH